MVLSPAFDNQLVERQRIVLRSDTRGALKRSDEGLWGFTGRKANYCHTEQAMVEGCNELCDTLLCYIT